MPKVVADGALAPSERRVIAAQTAGKAEPFGYSFRPLYGRDFRRRENHYHPKHTTTQFLKLIGVS